ncbi:hypothetical protein ACIPLA_10880 [Pseudomonas sp. NPDC086112]|uniref:hypothetical protein n=1 Tax=Pseudomonas sp. NPDC086112 TaxID=3364430 RepID=UPI00381BD237
MVDELDRVHAGDFWSTKGSSEDYIPNFVTAENGQERHFTRKAREAITQLTNTLHVNRLPGSLRVELDIYTTLVRQAVADLHADGEFSGLSEQEDNSASVRLKQLVEERLTKLVKEYTHYFPAWTLGMEKEKPFIIGPVTFMSRSDWIDSVDFPQNLKDRFLNETEANNRWKEILKEGLNRSHDASALIGLAEIIYGVIDKCPAILKVTIRGYEQDLSKKLAKLTCKTALDAVSLGFGAPEHFHQQALYEERLPPVGSDSLIETNGLLWLPGFVLGKRISFLSSQQVSEALDGMGNILSAFASALDGLVEPHSHSHPKLASRWATALDWFSEGNRESSDAVALAKLGTCLDVLACGGKNVGIREMVIHLTGVSGSEQVIQGTRPRTLEQLVKDIYDHGRSKILHGTHHDRLESFANERRQAASLARIALIECAVRLQGYSGVDEDKAFRTMPAV